MKKLILSLLLVLVGITSISQTTRTSLISAPVQGTLQSNTQVISVDEGKARHILWSTMRSDILSGISDLGTLDVSAEWTTGLSFSVTANNFPVGGIWYSATPGTVTLNASDATLDRIDLIVANKNGTVGKITGTPAVSPAEPDYDASLVYPIKFVMVRATETIPTNPNTGTAFSNTLIYDENTGPGTEWTTTVTGTLNAGSTSSWYSGSKSIEATNTTYDDKITFTSPVLLETSEISDLSFWIKFKESLLFRFIYVKFYNGTTQVGQTYPYMEPFNGTNRNSLQWQKITIHSSMLALPSAKYDRIQIYPYTNGWAGFNMDLVSLSSGSDIVSGASTIERTSQLTNDGEDGVNPYIIASDVPEYSLSTIDGSDDFSILRNGVAVTTLDLSPYVNNQEIYLTSGVLNTTTGQLTATFSDASTVNIDLVTLIETNTSELVNDGADGINPFITQLNVPTTTSAFTNDGDDGINPFLSVNDVIQPTQELLDVSVEWVSGLTFNVVADRFPVGNFWYSSTTANVTLAVANGTYDRIDLLVGNTNGTVGKVTGVASASPAPPDYDLDTQYPIRFVLVKTGATTPEGYSNTDGLVFDENVGEPTEWTYLPGTAAVAITATSPDTGTVSVEATTPGYEGVKLFNDVYISNLDLSLITFRFKLKAALLGNSAIEIRVYDYKAGISSTFKWKFSVRNGDHGFDGNNITTYQTIRLDAGDVNLPTFDFNMIEITAAKNGHPGWFVDNVKLQYNTSGVTIVNSNGSSVTNTSQLINDGENGTDKYMMNTTTTLNYLPKNTGTDTYGDSQIFDNGTSTGIGTATPYSKLQVAGGIQIGDDVGTAVATKVGTLRYRFDANNSYVDMCMQTGVGIYAWINIVQNTW